MLQLIQPLADQVRQVLSRSIVAMAVAILAAVVGIVALGFFAAAVYLLLEEVLPPAAAAAATGGILLIVMIALLLIARSFMRPPPVPQQVAEPDRPPPSSEFEMLFRLAEQVAPQVRRHTPLLAGLTFAAGFVLGLKPEARRAVWRAATKRR